MKPEQVLGVLSYWLLNNTLNSIVLTSHYAGDLENLPMEVWGVARKVARGECSRSYKADVHCMWMGYKLQ